MTLKQARTLGAFTLALAASSFLLMGASGGCGSNLHKAIVAADAIGSSLVTAESVNHQAYAEGLETLEERQAIALYVQGAAQANDAFVAQLQAAETSGSSVTAPQIADAFDGLLATITNLQSEGVLHLKSSEAQARFAAIVTTIQGELNLIYAMLGSATPSATPPPAVTLPTASIQPRIGRQPGPVGPAPRIPPHAPWLAITLTATEIEELLAIVTAAIGSGAELVQKLRGLNADTDTELLADASAQDAAAEKAAAADEAAS